MSATTPTALKKEKRVEEASNSWKKEREREMGEKKRGFQWLAYYRVGLANANIDLGKKEKLSDAKESLCTTSKEGKKMEGEREGREEEGFNRGRQRSSGPEEGRREERGRRKGRDRLAISEVKDLVPKR